MLRVGEGHHSRATGHTRAAAGTAGVRHHHPVEGVAHVLGHAADLPTARHAHHQVTADEHVNAVVQTVAHQPHLRRCDPFFVPTVQQLRKGTETSRVHREVAIGVNQGRPHAHGGPSKAVPRAINGEGVLHSRRFRHLLRQLRPLLPGRAFPWQLDTSLIEQGLVDIWSCHRQRIGEAVQPLGVALRPHGGQHRGGEVALVVAGISQIRTQIKQLAAEGAEVGDTRQVGTLPGFYLHRQLLVYRRVRHYVQHHRDARILGLELVQNRLHHVRLVAVGVVREPQLDGFDSRRCCGFLGRGFGGLHDRSLRWLWRRLSAGCQHQHQDGQ